MKKDLSAKRDNANKAISSLEKALARDWENDEELRDAVIQRFEFSLETCWKLYKAIFEDEGVVLSSPKAAFRHMLQAGILTKDQTEYSLKMVDDRNNTSHTYNKELADEIASRIPGYFDLLSKLINHSSI